MYYLYNSRLINYSGFNKDRLVYFQLEVDYYYNEANQNKYKKFQLIASKSNLINKEQNLKSIVLVTATCRT